MSDITRRGLLVAGGTFAGYALGVEKVLAQAIKTWFNQHLKA